MRRSVPRVSLASPPAGTAAPSRLTAGSAFLFMVLSVWLAFLSTSGEQALDRAVRQQSAAQEEAEEAAAAALAAVQNPAVI